MKNIVIIQPMGVAETELTEFRKLGNVTYYDTVCRDAVDWLERVKGADIVMTNVTGLKDAWPEAHDMFMSLTFVGFGFMDIDVLRKNNVLVANSPGCNQVAVTEWVTAMLLNHMRYLPASIKMSESDPKLPTGRSLFGKSACIVGKGNIGSRVGAVLEALCMEVGYYTRHDDLAAKVKDADILIDCLSLNPTTRQFYNDDFFSKAKDGVIFVSVSPNETQDLDAIEQHLTTGKIHHFITDNASALLYDTSDSTYNGFVRIRTLPSLPIWLLMPTILLRLLTKHVLRILRRTWRGSQSIWCMIQKIKLLKFANQTDDIWIQQVPPLIY